MPATDTVTLATSFISTVGFPIFVAVWMLFKGSKDSQDLKAVIGELTIAVRTLQEQRKGE